MLELFTGGIFGGLLGGIFRLAPEVIKFFDKQNERDHELKMFDRQCDLEKLRGQQKLDEIGANRQAATDSGVLQAFQAAIDQQAELSKASGGWAASASAAVRPLITYWVWTLYTIAFISLLVITWQVTQDPKQLVTLTLTGDFMALLSGITNYWFLDRTLAKRNL